MTRTVFCKGEFVVEEDASISIFDRGFLFGDGVFTTMHLNQGVVEGYYLHVERLQQQCKDLGIEPPSLDKAWIEKLVSLNKAKEGRWRLKVIITGGEERSSLDLARRTGSSPIIFLQPLDKQSYLPWKLGLLTYPVSNLSRYKTLAYLERLWIKQEAKKLGQDDCLVLNSASEILETAFANIFWRVGKEIFTPSSSLPLLPGVALGICLKVLQEEGYYVRSVCTSFDKLPTNAEVYLCNSLIVARPVSLIHQTKLAINLSFTKKLHELYIKSIYSSSFIL